MKRGDKILCFGTKGAKPPCWPEKVSEKSLKQAVSPRRPLFGCSYPQQGAQEQAQVKAGRRNLVSLGQILFSPQCGPAHAAFIKDVLEAAFQVHAALAQKRLPRLTFDGTRGAMKSFSQRGGQPFLAAPLSVGVPDDRANVELLDPGNFLDGKVAFVRCERAHEGILLVGPDTVNHFHRAGYSLTQVFGGVSINSIVLSFLIAASTAFVTGALALLLLTLPGDVQGCPFCSASQATRALMMAKSTLPQK